MLFSSLDIEEALGLWNLIHLETDSLASWGVIPCHFKRINTFEYPLRNLDDAKLGVENKGQILLREINVSQHASDQYLEI